MFLTSQWGKLVANPGRQRGLGLYRRALEQDRWGSHTESSLTSRLTLGTDICGLSRFTLLFVRL